MNGVGEVCRPESVHASSDEIVALCQEFPEVPIIEIMRLAIMHGAALTSCRLLMVSTSRFILKWQGVPPMTCAFSESTQPVPVPNGMSSALGLPDTMNFRIAVDAEIARLKGHGEPEALWLEELLPLYAVDMSPEEAARHIVVRRYPRAVQGNSAHRRCGLIKQLFDGWREWDFQRALRQTGRA